MRLPLLVAHRALKAVDTTNHAALAALHVPLPLPVYRFCVLVEAVHDRLYPTTCRCCWRRPNTEADPGAV